MSDESNPMSRAVGAPPKTRRRFAFAGVTAAVGVVALVFLLQPYLQTLRGNYRVTLYGRIVDQAGTGIQGVRIDCQLLYSTKIGALSVGRSENIATTSAYSDDAGNFEVGPVYSYSIDLKRISKDNRDLVPGAAMIPDFGGRLDDLSQRRRMPDTPARRVTLMFQYPVVTTPATQSTALPGRP